MKSKHQTIYNALPIVAAAYGEKFGVKVVIGQDSASTDGKVITVPKVPADYPNMDVVWGYLTHEAAHVRLTDFSVPHLSPLHGYLTNAIEDCRIEREMIRLFPGTAKTLNAIPQHMIELGHYDFVSEDEHPANIVGAYCLYWLQSELVGQPMLKPYADSALRAMQRTLPEGVNIRLQFLLRKVPNLTSTSEVSELASEIITMIKEEKEKEERGQQQNQPGNDQSSPQSNAQPGSSQGQDQSSQDQGNGQDGSAQDQGHQGTAQGQNQPHSGHGNQPNQGAQANQGTQQSNQSMQQRLEQLLGAGVSDMPVDAQSVLKRELQGAEGQSGDDMYMTVRQAAQIPKSEKGAQLLSSVKSNSSRIRQQLFGLVQAQNRVARRVDKRGKRLDHSRLTRLVAGDIRVFTQAADKKSPNTAVHLLVDASGSMDTMSSENKTRGQIASEAALSIALALEAISGVNPAVTFFGNSAAEPVYYAVKHGERVQPNAGRFAMQMRGGTPMAEAIWHSAFELSKTREQRKLLIVITDGEPGNRSAVKSVVDLCVRSDIEIIGIGIETAAVAGLFQPNIVINDVSDLRQTLFKLMENSLSLAA